MDSTQTETQNFYDMYNNLGHQRAAIEREIQLMNSIQDGFVTISLQKQHSKFEVDITTKLHKQASPKSSISVCDTA